MNNIPVCKNYRRLDIDDKQLIRYLMKGMWVIMSFGGFLAICFFLVFLISLLGYIQNREPAMFFLLLFGIAMGVLAFFITRQLCREWKRKIKPLQEAVYRDGQKIVLEGQLVAVSKLGKGRLMYRLGNVDISVDVILSARGKALIPSAVYAIDTLTDVPVALHVLVLPDGRQLLLQAVYAEETVLEPSFRTTVKENNNGAMSTYLLLTVAYLFLLFVNLSGIFPLGILLGVFSTTSLYIIALLLVGRRRKRPKQTIRITGQVTEIIVVPERIQIMGQPPSSTGDTWFRINGTAYPIISNNPPKGISVGDGIELILVRS